MVNMTFPVQPVWTEPRARLPKGKCILATLRHGHRGRIRTLGLWPMPGVRGLQHQEKQAIHTVRLCHELTQLRLNAASTPVTEYLSETPALA